VAIYLTPVARTAHLTPVTVEIRWHEKVDPRSRMAISYR
jgi:hypothetical protein